jgi:hypothetical protein
VVVDVATESSRDMALDTLHFWEKDFFKENPSFAFFNCFFLQTLPTVVFNHPGRGREAWAVFSALVRYALFLQLCVDRYCLFDSSFLEGDGVVDVVKMSMCWSLR